MTQEHEALSPSPPPMDKTGFPAIALATPEPHTPSFPATSPVGQYASPNNLQEANFESLSDAMVRMDQEKALVPGSQEWAEDEEKVFRILFLREYSPLLPRQWSMDFRGIPIPPQLFSETDECQPVIYSRAGNDFKGELGLCRWRQQLLTMTATRALIRLIELTSAVRTLSQTGQGEKVPQLIRKELEEYAKWAAQDGGYDDLDIVPNLIVDSVDISAGSEQIEEYMQTRMLKLAAEHRDYWRIERVPAGQTWKLSRVELAEVKTEKTESDDESAQANAIDMPRIKIEDDDEPVGCLEEVRYTQRPPVLYGIFVIHHSAIVLSLDSFKEGNKAVISYQVEAGFNAQYQGVWNAITMAIIICLARDHMVTMADDFVQLVGDPDSDPDA
jgi:hypothetical protein